MTATSTNRYIVKRYRAFAAAPSMSLGYEADGPRAALVSHFERYRGGVADGERFEIVSKWGEQGMTDRLVISTAEARAIWRDAMRQGAAR